MEHCMSVVKQYEASKVALIKAGKYTSTINLLETYMLPVAKRIIEKVNYHRSVLPLQRIWRKRSAQNKSTASTEVVAGSPAELVTAEAPMSTKL
jgi:hypothetical protein